MNLDRVAIIIRPRTSWEAMDLGSILAVTWFGPLYRLWLVAGMVTGVISLFISIASPWLGLLFFWWLKPLYEPFILYWLSRAVFGEHISISRGIRHWKKIILPGLVSTLSWQRFSPERSFLLPIRLLEDADRATQKKRKQVLGKNQSGALWLTISCFVIEIILCLGGIILIYLFIPEGAQDAMDYQFPIVSPMLYLACYLAACSLVAPVYVAGGFMLYLSRRVELEAWDIEIGFKKMAERQQHHISGQS